MMRSLRARYVVIRSAVCLPALLLGWNMAEGQGRADAMGWGSEVVRVIGEGDPTPEYIFGQVVALDVAPSGEIAVLDRQLVSLRVFSPEGRLLQTFGRQGEGPGDFTRDVAGVTFDPLGNPVVWDPGNNRISRFSGQGDFLASLPVRASNQRIVAWRGLGDGRVVERVWWSDDVDHLRVRHLDGEEDAPLVHFRYGRQENLASAGSPIELLGDRPLWTLTQSGTLVWAYSALGVRPQLTVREELEGSGADLTFPLGPIFLGVALPPEAQSELRDRAVEAWAEALGRNPQEMRTLGERFSLPDSIPALTGLSPGPGNTVLVQSARSAWELSGHGLFALFHLPLGGDRWALVDLERRLVASIELPQGYLPMVARGDLLYGVHRDGWGVERIMVVRAIAPRGG